MRDGRVLAQGTSAELRKRAGTDNIETAFLWFAKDSAAATPGAGTTPGTQSQETAR